MFWSKCEIWQSVYNLQFGFMETNSTWKAFAEYIENLQIDTEIACRQTDPGFKKKHAFYLNIFYWFAPAFSGVKKEIVQRLSLAGYTYFRSALLFDKMMDTPPADKKQVVQLIMLGLSYQECAIKELTKLLPDDTYFWKEFDTIKKEYTQANVLEKNLSKDNQPVSWQQFEQIARGKSNLSIASALSLCSMANDFTHYEILKESLLLFHTGYQLFDDIDDFAGDLSANQKTYAICRVEEFVMNNIRADGEITNKEKNKYLYISGIASELLDDAKIKFKESLKKVEGLPVDGYKRVIKSEIAKCDTLVWEIDQSLKKTRVKSERSNGYRKPIPGNLLHDEICHSLEKGVSFLESSFDERSVWSDFLTNAGVSTGWVTGYIGFHLSEVGLGVEVVTKATHQIKNKIDSYGSFNKTMIRDGDSLAFTIGLLSQYDIETAEKFADSWLQYQQNGGGWVTYKDPDQLKQKLELPAAQDVTGWTSPHSCVSATSALILEKLPRLNGRRQKTLEFLAGCQAPEGYIPSYWWTSPVYATAYAIMAFADEPEWKNCREKSLQWLSSNQMQNGAWSTGFTNDGESAFYTALALKALMCQEEDYQKEIEKGIRWLINHQMSDGSWQAQRILRIPATDVTNPQMVKRWRRSSFGVNTLIDDHYRNFTTAAVCSTLGNYEVLLLGKGIRRPFLNTTGGR